MLLIGTRDDNGKPFWSFPKGHQEDGETDIETAIRETKEETNLDVKIIDIIENGIKEIGWFKDSRFRSSNS